MKIFNWLQRKLHRNADYKMLSLDQEMKSTKYDRDEEALLDQAALVEMLDGWHDGILTIGTFGLDQLDPFSSTEEENSIRAADDDDEEEEEEDSLNALEAFERELEALKDSLSGMYADDEMPKYCPLNDNDADDDALHYSFDPEGEKKSNEGRRTTLADLFLADSAPVAATKSSSGAAAEDLEKKKKLASRSKLSPSFAKKREDSRPTMKLRRMITRMVKRKIHPEMGRDALVADRSVHPALLGPARSDCRFKLPRYCGHKHRENESISLLIGGYDMVICLFACTLGVISFILYTTCIDTNMGPKCVLGINFEKKYAPMDGYIHGYARLQLDANEAHINDYIKIQLMPH